MKKKPTVDEVTYKELCSIDNLKLAWRRINASTNNLSYKNYYRTLFWYYECDLNSNLECLGKRLENHTYKPSKGLRIYKPKQSGLQRPITLLDVNDLIVYQAIANVIINRFYEKRKEFEGEFVFSNLFNRESDTNIFLFKNWKDGYRKYKRKISWNYSNGLTYTAHFDLAAYYDTVDQNSLLADLFKDTRNEIGTLLYDCLQEWSNKTESDSKKISHGIPQGPLSSSVFGELFLLSIDEFLVKSKICYSRYVDDIVIQGKTIEEVQRAVILLDIKCKEKGLVPQSSKVSIFEAKSADEAIGKAPSLTSTIKLDFFSHEEKALELLDAAFKTESFDSSTIRYVLKTYDESDILIEKAMSEFFLHYEFSEEICIYLKRFVHTKSSDILHFVSNCLNRIIPYDYVESEVWVLLSSLYGYENISIFAQMGISRFKNSSDSLKYGIYKYLSKLEDNRFLRFLSHENNKILLELLIEEISHKCIRNPNFEELTEFYVKRDSDTLNKFLAQHLYFMFLCDKISNDEYQRLASRLPELNMQNLETINHYLKVDFEIDCGIDWKVLFEDKFEHATAIFYHAHLAGVRHKSEWLNAIDSFNDLLVRAFIELLNKRKPELETPTLITKDKKANSIGCLLDRGTHLAQSYPRLINSAFSIHNRRCENPLSHAFNEKTLKLTSFVTKTEFYKYLKEEKVVLTEIIQVFREHFQNKA